MSKLKKTAAGILVSLALATGGVVATAPAAQASTCGWNYSPWQWWNPNGQTFWYYNCSSMAKYVRVSKWIVTTCKVVTPYQETYHYRLDGVTGYSATYTPC